MRTNLSLILAKSALIAAAIFAVPASAQSVNDFTLPPPPPEEQPEVQGPADDSGAVPIGPRVITEEAEDDAPVAAEPAASEPEVEDTGTAVDTSSDQTVSRPAPGPNQTSERITAPAAQPQPNIDPVQPFEVPASPPSETADNLLPESDPITFPPLVAEQDNTPAETGATEASPQWIWLAIGGGLLLLMLIAGLLYWRRRNEKKVPTIERPIVADGNEQDGNVTAENKVQISVEVVNLTRSLMTMTLKCRICLTNRSDKAVRDLSLSADLASAHRAVPMEQQLALPETDLTERTVIERIGPHQMRAEQMSLQLPVAQLNAFRQGEAALCVPLLRMRMSTPSTDPKVRTFAIGIDPGTPAARLQPIPLHVPPGSYPAANSRPLD